MGDSWLIGHPWAENYRYVCHECAKLEWACSLDENKTSPWYSVHAETWDLLDFGMTGPQIAEERVEEWRNGPARYEPRVGAEEWTPGSSGSEAEAEAEADEDGEKGDERAEEAGDASEGDKQQEEDSSATGNDEASRNRH
jgi:hypothetical protein